MSNLKEEKCEKCEHFDDFHGFCGAYKGFAVNFVMSCTKMKEKPQEVNMEEECDLVEEGINDLKTLVKNTLAKVVMSQKLKDIKDLKLNLYRYIQDDAEVYCRGYILKECEEDVIKDIGCGVFTENIIVELVLSNQYLVILLTTGSVETEYSDMN